MRLSLITIFYLFLFGTSAEAQQLDFKSDFKQSDLEFRAVAEIGFIAVLAHKIQLGNDGSYFNYVKDGGQDVLFPTTRFSIELDHKAKNKFIFLYQPLRIETQSLLRTDLIANGVTFPGSTGINSLYNFPFYRISYLRELSKDNERLDFAIGLSLQIRNATISFESTDGQLYTDNRGIGPVPALKVRSKYHMSDRYYTELEVDGIYAPVSYLNGSDNEIVGAILDASLRLGAEVNPQTDLYVNLRYLAGGAVGTDTGDVWPGDGYVKNWLHFLNISAGFILKL